MKNRLARLLKVLEWYPRSGAPDIDALALQLGTTPATIRRDLRDLREAGAFANEARATTTTPSTELPSFAKVPPANDTAPVSFLPGEPGAPTSAPTPDEELAAMYVGARFLSVGGEPDAAERAQAVIARVERQASPELLRRLAELDTRFRFGPRTSERRTRQLVAQAITERRVLRIKYRGERDAEARIREVEPLAQFFIHDRWSFFAYCRTAGDIRQFRHERCTEAGLLDVYFTERGGFTLENFIEQRRRVSNEPAARTEASQPSHEREPTPPRTVVAR